MNHTSAMHDVFCEDVLEGLQKPRKELPCKYFYDRQGSELFERICRTPEYYPTRTEIKIMDQFVDEMCAEIGRKALIVEYGSGSGLKTRMLLSHLEEPAAFVPVDISEDFLRRTAEKLQREFPWIEIVPVCADFMRPLHLPPVSKSSSREVVYFPGSTIGNLNPAEAEGFLYRCGELCGHGGGLLIGVDLKKNRKLLEAAYNDSWGVTEAFNLNLLERINRELDADFRPEHFQHRAFYNDREGCIEMHLLSTRRQKVRIAGQEIGFDKLETIRTERSYKYTPEEFASLAGRAGLELQKIWTDPDGLFSVQFFAVDGMHRAA